MVSSNLRPSLLQRLNKLAEESGRSTVSLADTCLLARRFHCSRRQVELAALEVGLVPERYRKNIGTVGREGQTRLLRATVAVVGVGGLGGWVAEGLARMGLGHLVLIDGDVYAEDNLNRQLGCVERVVGQPKVSVLCRRIAEVNGAVTVTVRMEWLREDNAADLLAGADVVVDALDTLPARFVLQGAAGQLGLPLVHGAIAGYTGQVMTIFPGDRGLSALYGDADGVPERGLETQLGNPAATPMMIAAWQTQEVVKLLTERGTPLRGKLLIFDMEHADMTDIDLS